MAKISAPAPCAFQVPKSFVITVLLTKIFPQLNTFSLYIFNPSSAGSDWQFNNNKVGCIIIQEAKIAEDNHAIAIYTINTKNKSGRNTVPVKIEYTTPDGRYVTEEKIITYQVTKDTVLNIPK